MSTHQDHPRQIRQLTADDAAAYRRIRHAMLTGAPQAYFSSPEDETDRDDAAWAKRLADPNAVTFGVSVDGDGNGDGNGDGDGDGDVDGTLVAVATIFRHERVKAKHRAGIVAVWCEPEHRRSGHAAAVIEAAIDHARTWPDVQRLEIGVSSESPAAHRLYERLGFRAWGREPQAMWLGDRFTEEVHMVRMLEPRDD
ncbi:MAG: N-acetyltransferase family protein [Phycisphaerales bacterium]